MRDYLRQKYEYNPELDTFIYKEDLTKGDDWNNLNVGQEVKVILSSGKRYLFCNDALYNMDQLITIYEIGNYTNPHKYQTKDLIEESLKVKESLSKLSITELTDLNKRLFNGESVSSIIDRVKGKKDRSKPLDVNDKEINRLTGFPKHIYFDGKRWGFYVKLKYKGKTHNRTHIKNLEEALKIRNVLYEELNEANLNGEDMANYVSTNGRK